MITITSINLILSNAFLLSGERHILVDTGGAPALGLLKRALRQHGIGARDLSLIILTHAHFDHAGNVAAMQKEYQCPVAVHQLEKEFLESGINAPIIPIHPLGRVLMPMMGSNFSPATVDILIEDDFDLTPYGVEARTLHTPGHTPGSISIITNDGRALVGDLIGGGWPLGQFQPGKPRYHYWASDLADVKTSLERILSFTPSRIYAGHGGPLDGQAAIEFFKPEQALTKA